jgi:hypothetical protein
MEESDNRSEEYKGTIRFPAAKGRCIGKALHVSQKPTLCASLVGLGCQQIFQGQTP